MKDARRLTLEEKVGQLFFVGFQGHAPDGETRAILDRVRPGGYLLFQRNIDGLDQIYELTNELRSLHGVPSFLAIDHEGGRVDRLKQIFAPIPSMSELAAAGTAPLRAGARIIAAELEATGFNTDFAPVVDVQSPGSIMASRSLSSDPGEAGRLASAFIEELTKKNIVACVKHFPGLGGATADPHFVLPTVGRSKRQLLQGDTLPFVRVLDETGLILVAHAHYPALGDEKPIPASLSPRVVEGLLRKKLGFAGVVVTDDLTMGAISAIGLTPELFLAAFEAGNDLLLFSQTTPLLEKGFKTIVRAARQSPALRRRVDESVERILNLKRRIQFSPLRYRAHSKSRIVRQIDKLRESVAIELSGKARSRAL